VSTAGHNGRGDPAKFDFSLFGVSDTEVLGMVDDLADENGWVTTYGVRQQLGEKPPDRLYNIGQRLGWMRRFGWLEKGERTKVESWVGPGWEWTSTWRLTAMGHAILDNPNLSRTVENALEKMNPAQRVRLAREIGESGNAGPNEIRAALRRQWQRSMGGRR